MVDGLESEVSGFAQVVRLNLHDPVGQQLAAQHQVGTVPTFLVLDGDGREVQRLQGIPDRQYLRRALRAVANSQ